jgi:hypothetical protein
VAVIRVRAFCAPRRSVRNSTCRMK